MDRIKADYQSMPDWQDIQVYEVVPTGAHTWTATLGTGQDIRYLVTGVGTLRGGKATCLHRVDGSLIRCGSRER
ncbi:MAG TPA: hypothetical protein VGR21_11930 [Cryptosporangiaceae bacterium]|nr:hypothetical protein [Cryptosporangiaceae bacterium]